jgi:hypothetical protein
MCIHFNFKNERKRTKTGSGTKTNGNSRFGAQQIIGNFDDSRRRIQVSFQKAQITKFRFEERAFGRLKTTI